MRCGVMLILYALWAQAALSDQERIAVEALLRLENVNLDQNARLRESVNKLLARTRGTPEFVKLALHFKVPGQEPGLLEAALWNRSTEAGTAAMKALLERNATNLIVAALASTNAAHCIQALANTKLRDGMTLILPIVSDEKREATVRRQAVKGLAQTQDGAKALLDLVIRDKLAEALKFTASSELHRAPWPDIRTRAESLLPLPAGLNAQPLPPLAQLAKMKGDPVKGEKVFNSPTAGCATCHQVKGRGIDFGPDLTEIGSKLAREALYESILDPSAGISFGYEAWQIELKSGDELYGLIVSETPEEVAVKGVGGIVSRCKAGDIARRTQARLSIMPAGIQQNMSTQDLVDLIEYLDALKKP